MENAENSSQQSEMSPQSMAQRQHEAIDRMAEAAHRTLDRLANSATPAADWLSGNKEKLMQGQEQLVEDVGEYVRENPLAALGIALAAGYVVGRLMSR